MASNYDVLSGVQYDPRLDDNQSIGLLHDALTKASNQYDTAQSSIAESQGALANEAAMYARDPDKPMLQQKLAEIQSIPDMVNQKYNGDYGAAKAEIASKILQAKPYFDQAKQAYDQEQKVNPIYQQLSAQGKLIPEVNNPHAQSIFDAKGNYIGMPQYNPTERPDYGDIVYNDIGKAIDQMVIEGKISQADKAGYLENISKRGVSAISDPELRDRIARYIPEFEAKTPFTKDPLMQNTYQGNTSKYIEDVLKSRVSEGLQRQNMVDKGYWENYKLAQAKAQPPQQPSKVLINPTGSTAFSTGYGTSKPEDLSTIKSTFQSPRMGSMDIAETRGGNSIFDSKGNIVQPAAPPEKQDVDNDDGLVSKLFGDKDYNTTNSADYKNYTDEYNQKKEFVSDVIGKMRESYPDDVKGLTPQQIFNKAATDKDKYAITMSNDYQIGHPKLAKEIANNLAGSLDESEVYMRNSSGNTTKSWQGKKGIAATLGTNPAGLKEYIKDNPNQLRWDDGEMAYALLVPKGVSDISADGKYNMKGFNGDMAKIYLSGSSEDIHLRNSVKTLENSVKGDYKGDGLTVPTTMGNENVNIVLPKGRIPLGTSDPVFEIRDNKGNPLTINTVDPATGQPKQISKVPYSFLKEQFIRTKDAQLQQRARELDSQTKRYKSGQLDQSQEQGDETE